jgi:hypothetical protein
MSRLHVIVEGKLSLLHASFCHGPHLVRVLEWWRSSFNHDLSPLQFAHSGIPQKHFSAFALQGARAALQHLVEHIQKRSACRPTGRHGEVLERNVRGSSKLARARKRLRFKPHHIPQGKGSSLGVCSFTADTQRISEFSVSLIRFGLQRACGKAALCPSRVICAPRSASRRRTVYLPLRKDNAPRPPLAARPQLPDQPERQPARKDRANS